MRQRIGKRLGSCVVPALLLAMVRISSAQAVSAVPKLDLNRYMGVWYEIAELPIKAERRCASDGRVLYALGDKKDSFQMGTFCEQKNGSPGSWGANGKMDKTGDGRLKLSRLVLFHKKYYVLATGPDYDWALVGTPNHKMLWVLSRESTLAPDALAQLKSKASAFGFKTDKLVTLPQHPTLSAATSPVTAPPARPSP